MARPTLEQLYKYMGDEPRTFGYGALLVYDRLKTNLLLMQEHILRADAKAWIEPVSGEHSENGVTTKLSNIGFGPAVLSFENSNIGSSMAALSIPVVSGQLTEWRREAGAELPTLVGISYLDPLTAPRVKMHIRLKDGANGSVDEDGRVYIDLSEATSHYFEVSQWGDLNTKLGQLIKAKFEDPERGKQEWELSTLAHVPGDMNPTAFRVRTHSLANAGNTMPSTNRAEMEEGAVIVGVAFNGREVGNLPDEDKLLPYLLPERGAGGGYSLGVYLSSEVWVSAIFKDLFDNLDPSLYGAREIELEEGDKGFYIGAEGGGLKLSAQYSLLDEPEAYVEINFSAIMGRLKFSVGFGGISCEWSCDEKVEKAIHMGVFVGGRWDRASGSLHMQMKASCFLKAEMEGSSLVLKAEQVITEGRWANEDGLEDENAKEGWRRFVSHLERQVALLLGGITGKLEVLDFWRLNGLLFRNGQRSVPETFAAPGDVGMFGELAPTLTAFAIDPIEKKLIAGAKQPLTLTPQPDGEVTWEVKALPDDPENPEGPEQLGEVVGGVYGAPQAETIKGTFRQVIITATAGENTSSALFTIVPKAVAVRPILQNALYSNPGKPERYVLEGGSVEAVLTWTEGAGFKGELRDPLPAEYDELNIPRDKNTKVYVAPEKDPDSGPVLGALMQLDQVHVTGAGLTQTIDITVLWTPTSATLKVEAQGEALKLVLAVQSWGGDPVDLPPAGTKWFVAKGTGTLDEVAGTYKPGADEGDYVIIAGVGIASGNWNYAVLPMPYTVDEAKAFHEMNESMNATNARAAFTAEQIQGMEEVKKAFSSLIKART
ncbi:hypothetical protein [Pseudomonas sp.]|uniref:hypothetical protein n=1 Tax=Pseudomonas sp. TaxID=306 RepID=UPI0027B982DB|nr:hypothetical protein [Pseudomonas sp.]